MSYTKRNKYGVGTDPASIAKRTVDNIVFDSIREAAAYLQFRALERSGAIQKLELQVPFVIHAFPSADMFLALMNQRETPPIRPICKYIADFVVTEKDGTVRVYDAKGMSTPLYKLKRKFVEAEYGIRIVEI